MRRAFRTLFLLTLLGLAAFWFLTAPQRIEPDLIAGLEGDPVRGEAVFWAAGCASCHAADKAEGEARLILSGGRSFASDFGTFYAPNISSDPINGIGLWRAEEFVTALMKGTSPKGKHYDPALPYTAYALAEPADLVSLFAYMRTLPASDTPSREHDVGFPFSIRRLLGGWKLLFGRAEWALEGEQSEKIARGRYLSEALAHCGECHTPRNALGGLNRARWLAGGPVPGAERGRFPNITPGALDWSESDIAHYMKSGFTPEFDTAGGHMVEVVENFARLSQDDRDAVAAYLKAVPAVTNNRP
ncbi:MAG TPA: diacylglycerol kinase [Aliiroseovarius sp.]|nr:diacylglycerol kinase [Aliiroseovarius sp.]